MKKIIFIIGILFSFKIYSQIDLKKLEDLAGKDLKVGLVLSGGGAKGFAHIAALEAIEKAGVRIDYIGGTSMGAIIGGLYAAGYKAAQLDSIFQKIDFEELMQDQLPRSSQSFYEKENQDRYVFSLPIERGRIGMPTSFSKGNNLYNLLVQLLYPVKDINDFSKLPIPFLCVATDVEKGTEILLEHGSLPEAVMASGTLPTLFSPIEIDGVSLIDGGLLNNYPVDEIKAKGMDVIIGVDIQAPLHKRQRLHSAIDILMQITSYKIATDMTQKRLHTDIYIKPDMTNYNVVSFKEGNAIIDSGRVAVQKKYPEIEALAKYQTPKTIPPIKKIDSLHISKLSFSGNKHYSNEYLRGKLRFKWGDKISFNDLRDGVLNIMGTQNFKSIRYTICPEEDGEEIRFRLVENPNRTQVKMAVHYDNLYKTGVLLNLTKKSFLQKNSTLSFDFIAGDNLRYKFDYYVDNGFYTSYGIRSFFNQFSRDVSYENFRSDIIGHFPEIDEVKVRLADLTNQLYIQTIFGEKFLMGLGVEHRLLRIKTNLMKQEFENSNYYSTYGYIKYDSLDDKVVPTSGLFFDGVSHWYLFSSGIREPYDSFLLSKFTFGGAFSPSKRFSATMLASAGFTIERPNANTTLPFVFGGYGENLFGNFLPFIGYDYLSFGGYNFLKTEAILNYRFYKKNYLNLTANFANVTTDFNLKNWVSLPKFSGYALGITSKTLIGPIELKYSYSPEIKKSFWLFNLGFWF